MHIIIIPPGYSRSISFFCITHLRDELAVAAKSNSRTRWLVSPEWIAFQFSRFRTSAANVYVTFDLVAWRPAFNDIIRLYWTPWSFRPTWKINVSTRPTHRTRVYQRGMSQLQREFLPLGFDKFQPTLRVEKSFTNSHPRRLMSSLEIIDSFIGANPILVKFCLLRDYYYREWAKSKIDNNNNNNSVLLYFKYAIKVFL